MGAVAFQLGIASICVGYAFTSAFLFAAGAMIWTLAAISRGVFQPRKHVDSLVRTALTLILAITISAAQIHSDAQAISDPQLPQSAQLSSPPTRKKHVTRVFAQPEVIPPASRVVVEGVLGSHPSTRDHPASPHAQRSKEDPPPVHSIIFHPFHRRIPTLSMVIERS